MSTEHDWSKPLPEVPREAAPGMLGQREDAPRSMRWPKSVGAGIDELAKEFDVDWSTIAMHLVDKALAEVKAARAKKKSLKKTA